MRQRKRDTCAEDWLQLKEILHIFEWMRNCIDTLNYVTDYDDQLVMLWSIAWLRLRKSLQTSIICTDDRVQNTHNVLAQVNIDAEQREAMTLSSAIVEINRVLEPHLHPFNLIVRQFWMSIGFPQVI